MARQISDDFYRAAYHAGISYEKNVCPSVRPSVRLSNARILTKRKNLLPIFLYDMKDRSSYFPT